MLDGYFSVKADWGGIVHVLSSGIIAMPQNTPNLLYRCIISMFSWSWSILGLEHEVVVLVFNEKVFKTLITDNTNVIISYIHNCETLS